MRDCWMSSAWRRSRPHPPGTDEERMMPTKQALVSVGRIDQLIYAVRGQRVMLDRDLAMLYGAETRVLNQAVRRNRERFPPDFMLELTRKEILRISQIVISSDIKFSKRVTGFTEQGADNRVFYDFGGKAR